MFRLCTRAKCNHRAKDDQALRLHLALVHGEGYVCDNEECIAVFDTQEEATACGKTQDKFVNWNEKTGSSRTSGSRGGGTSV